MKLQQKVFVFDSDIDFDKTLVKILVNGKDESLSPRYLFKDLEMECGKISGYSLLQFYKVDKGSLWDKEGNEITFSDTKEKKIPVEKVRDPLAFVAESLEVNLQYIKDVSALLGLIEIEKTISGLSNAEKKIIVDDREEEYTAKELAKKEAEAKVDQENRIAEAKKAADKEAADKEAEEKKKEAEAAAEQENKTEEKKIPEGDHILAPKDQKLLHRKYQRMGFAEYKKDNYKFYYGEDVPDNEQPFLLIDHDDYYEKLDGSVVFEKDGEVEYEFSDTDDIDKLLILKDGKISIEKL